MTRHTIREKLSNTNMDLDIFQKQVLVLLSIFFLNSRLFESSKANLTIEKVDTIAGIKQNNRESVMTK